MGNTGFQVELNVLEQYKILRFLSLYFLNYVFSWKIKLLTKWNNKNGIYGSQ